jgi:hypothetical protein
MGSGSFNCVVKLDRLQLDANALRAWMHVCGVAPAGCVARIAKPYSDADFAERVDEFVISAFAHKREFGPRILAFGWLENFNAAFMVLPLYDSTVTRVLRTQLDSPYALVNTVHLLVETFERSARAGILHADGKGENMLFRSGEIVFIDFDDHYLVDFHARKMRNEQGVAVDWGCIFIVQVVMFVAYFCGDNLLRRRLIDALRGTSGVFRDYEAAFRSNPEKCDILAGFPRAKLAFYVFMDSYTAHWDCDQTFRSRDWAALQRRVFTA